MMVTSYRTMPCRDTSQDLRSVLLVCVQERGGEIEGEEGREGGREREREREGGRDRESGKKRVSVLGSIIIILYARTSMIFHTDYSECTDW